MVGMSFVGFWLCFVYFSMGLFIKRVIKGPGDRRQISKNMKLVILDVGIGVKEEGVIEEECVIEVVV
jgi:hypothetical protein